MRRKLKLNTPAPRPLRTKTRAELDAVFKQALLAADGSTGAHCIHELWMRGEMGIHVQHQIDALWQRAAKSIPEWLPTRFIQWLPIVYETTQLFTPEQRGRSNVYLVLLDYSERSEPYGIYVGMTHYPPAQRFDQHKAGIRAAGSVLKRGLEVLAGPTLHLQHIRRAEAAEIEQQLAEALRARGLWVQGGH